MKKLEQKIKCQKCGHEQTLALDIDSAMRNTILKQYAAEVRSELESKVQQKISAVQEQERKSYDEKLKQISNKIKTNESQLYSNQIAKLKNDLVQKTSQIDQLKQHQSKLDEKESSLIQKEEELKRLSNHINIKVAEQVNFKLKDIEEMKEKEYTKETNYLKDALKAKSEEMGELKKLIATLNNQIENLESKDKETQDRIKREVNESIKDTSNHYKFLIEEAKKEKDTLSAQIEKLKTSRSSNIKGDVGEDYIETEVVKHFPHYHIERIPKGVDGGDAIVEVIEDTPPFQKCGKILLESKNTNSFSYNYITKARQDSIKSGVDCVILVTKTMPDNTASGFCYKDGVWITSFHYLTNLIKALAFGLIQINKHRNSCVNKDKKMQNLYDFLCSNEYKNLLTSFLKQSELLEDILEKEQKTMSQSWNKRKKHLSEIKYNSNEIYSRIKAILSANGSDDADTTIDDYEVEDI